MTADSYALLDGLRRRPAMYTGYTTLESINSFLAGYSVGAGRLDGEGTNDPLLIPLEFPDWVAYRLHFDESTSGWCGMIRSKTDSDRAAIERFFTLLEEYRNRQEHVVARLIGFHRTYLRGVQSDANSGSVPDAFETRSWPSSIRLVTYTDDPGFFVYSDTDEEMPGTPFYPSFDWFESFFGASRDILTLLDPNWSPE